MTQPNFTIRRATLDDVGSLIELWKSMRFPTEELARRVTEFQVAQNPEGKLSGAVGLQMAQRQGQIHSEGFNDFAVADQVRPLLWERLQSVATNHGLVRLWTRESAPFWKQCGLTKPDAEALKKLPEPWRTDNADWLSLKLKEDLEEVISADKEFALFMEAERLRTQRALQQAKILKFIATLVALALVGLVAVGAFLIWKRNPGLLHR